MEEIVGRVEFGPENHSVPCYCLQCDVQRKAKWYMSDLGGPTPLAPGAIRQFPTGATRDKEEGKYDYEGFLSPIVIERYAAYMHKHRVQADGAIRDSDNWTKGIPKHAYMKSAWRHFMDWWMEHRKGGKRNDLLEEALCALMFNCMGYLFELLKEEKV